MFQQKARDLVENSRGMGIDGQDAFCQGVLDTLVNYYRESLLDVDVVTAAAGCGVLIMGETKYAKVYRAFSIDALLLGEDQLVPGWITVDAADHIGIDTEEFLTAFVRFHRLQMRGDVIIKNGRPVAGLVYSIRECIEPFCKNASKRAEELRKLVKGKVPPEQRKPIELTTLADVEERKNQYLYYPYLQAGAVNIITGETNTGKSMFVAGIIADLTRRRDLVPGCQYRGEDEYGASAIIISREDY